ncbi:DUF4232 domain-containing protein [Streptomyces lancefieldiae]|uniref:DUF4232 domain-containing protein n=1 Tax=Streptomyces lancefieldiae TaxID=3075520 RepID=A0ABU3B129_9ACTN|nr:DUF4232 domain-containing protein [Streptomyces sp. DSM 40712]MDT0616163.1 DUF4232 domain-containing protein [Streptomyces sp. DSM 40712]
MKHHKLLPGAVLCCAVLGGCTGPSTDSTAGHPPTASSSPAPAATVTVTRPAEAGTPSASGDPAPHTSLITKDTPSVPAQPDIGHPCHTSALRASVGANRPGAGRSNFAVVLTNHSVHTCTLRGFPGLAFVNGKGEAVTPDPERAMGQEQPSVTLPPGASAWSAMTYTNPAVTGVTTVTPTDLLITPPGEAAWLSVRWAGGGVSNTGKASVPQVSPLRAGDGT